MIVNRKILNQPCVFSSRISKQTCWLCLFSHLKVACHVEGFCNIFLFDECYSNYDSGFVESMALWISFRRGVDFCVAMLMLVGAIVVDGACCCNGEVGYFSSFSFD